MIAALLVDGREPWHWQDYRRSLLLWKHDDVYVAQFIAGQELIGIEHPIEIAVYQGKRIIGRAAVGYEKIKVGDNLRIDWKVHIPTIAGTVDPDLDIPKGKSPVPRIPYYTQEENLGEPQVQHEPAEAKDAETETATG